MNEIERQTLADVIELTVSLSGLTVELRRRVKALESLLLQPKSSAYQTRFVEADERGETLYEGILALTQKLAVAKDRLRTADKIG